MRHLGTALAVLCTGLASPVFAQEGVPDGGLPAILDPAAPDGGERSSLVLQQRESTLNVGEEELKALTAAPGYVASYIVGCEDIHTYCWLDIEMPKQLLDFDGGEIRAIMQHETDPTDQLRTIDIHVGCEWTDDRYGKRGRYVGRYCWARQVGGGEYSFVLGDPTPHTAFAPWGWFWIADHALFQNNAVLGGNKIRLASHPHVTTRVIFYD
jgi:hypothetical protein